MLKKWFGKSSTSAKKPADIEDAAAVDSAADAEARLDAIGAREHATLPAPEPEPEPEPSAGWVARLARGLKKTSGQISDNLGGIFTKKKLDADMLDALEDALIMADMGVEASADLREWLGSQRMGKDVTEAEVRELLASRISQILAPVALPLMVEGHKPFIISMVGVNGNGKTTTAAKLAHYYQAQGKRVMLAAADTFRAAAVEQLQAWGMRLGCEVIAGADGADAASVAYQAYEQAKKADVDVLIVDTAGRLHNKAGLMDELKKIHRVLAKQDALAPHATLMVLDATTGQNAHNQLKIFREMVSVSGLIVTKLDGTAKGGVLVGLAKVFGTPIHAIGVGEGLDDLRPFAADDFARLLMGVSGL